MSCCDASGRTKWGIFALLAVAGVVLPSVSGPVYFGTLAGHSGPESFRGCAHCVQDFGLEVLKSVNATDIVNKLEKIHERNEHNHFHHHGHHPHHPPHHHHHHHDEMHGPPHGHPEDGPWHDHPEGMHGHPEGDLLLAHTEGAPPDFEFDEDECITNKDLEDLKPDLESLVIPDWQDECKDVCTPVLKAVPLAATVSGVLLFVGLCSAIASLIPLCMLCCGSCKDASPSVVAPWQPSSYSAVPHADPVGTHAAAGSTAAAPTDDAKIPLLQQKV